MPPLTLTKGTVGILPAGALGVGFFYHLTQGLNPAALAARRVFFLERPGSASAKSLRAVQALQIVGPEDAGARAVPAAGLLDSGALPACQRAGRLPEVVLVCPNPDQLLGIISQLVELLEAAHAREPLELAGAEHELPFPIIILSSNGIYFQRVRQTFIEKLEEAVLFGRLPDLWPDLGAAILGRFLRGVTIQTGVREGAGLQTIYRPGPRGQTRLGGGGARARRRAAALLSELGGWFETADEFSATRLEFDKALINLSGNLLGQIYAIDGRGHFRLLKNAEIFDSAHEGEIRELVDHAMAIGRAMKIYQPEEAREPVVQTILAAGRMHGRHTPSSLQYIALGLAHGTLAAEVTPTEAWLLDPLIRYGRSAGLDDAVAYFENLKARLVAKLRLAAEKGRNERDAHPYLEER